MTREGNPSFLQAATVVPTVIMKDFTERDPRTYAIIGAAMEVHKQLGCGFLEPVYQEALAVEFSRRAILFDREVTLPIFYKNVRFDTPYRVDFICSEEVAVELKALAKLSGTEGAQLINYLKASGLEIGLLLNFGTVPSNTGGSYFLTAKNLCNLWT